MLMDKHQETDISIIHLHHQVLLRLVMAVVILNFLLLEVVALVVDLMDLVAVLVV
tara:strand:+ start:162 stop:326 length:165 start_codon:yes stop_codon:yes gene_type:complete